MDTKQPSIVVGVFDNRGNADTAVGQLVKAGFRPEQIGVAMRQFDDAFAWSTTPDASDRATNAESGAITGALTGLGFGTLAGLGVVAGVVPVVGPAIAAGTLGVILSNAAAGAGIAGIAGALIGAGLPEEEAEHYDNEFAAGRVIVSVMADGRYQEALSIMGRNDGSTMSAQKAAVVGTL